MNNSNSK